MTYLWTSCFFKAFLTVQLLELILVLNFDKRNEMQEMPD